MDSGVPKHCRAGSIQLRLRQKICKTEERPYQHLCWHGRKSFKACFTLPLSKAKHLFRLSRVSVSRSLHIARVSGHRCAAQRPDCAGRRPPFRRAQRPPGDGSRQPLSHPSGCGFGSNQNGEVLRCPFQNGVGRNLVIQDHCTPALWVTLRADERAELHLATFL